MKIILRTLDEEEDHYCGYETQGDWRFWTNGSLEATVSQMGDPDGELVVLIHELVEGYLCRKNGISSEEVSDFDRIFEAERENGKHTALAEPGDDPRAPYRKEHQAATIVEMLVLHMLGGSWPDHCQEILK